MAAKTVAPKATPAPGTPRRRRQVPRLWVYAAKRLAFVPVGLFIVVSLSFALVNLIPSDPARQIGGELADESQLDQIRQNLGLHDPILVRYGRFIRDLFLHFDLGRSYTSDRPVVDEIAERLPNTMELAFFGLLLAVALGLLVGCAGGYFQGRWPDAVARTMVRAIQALPEFFLGLILIFVFFFVLGWLPEPTGQLGLLDVEPPAVTHSLLLDSAIAGDWGLFQSVALRSVLPVVTLGIAYSAFLAKTAQSTVAKAMGSYQVEFARACGLSEWKVFGYAFRVARTPIMTFGAILAAVVVGGVVLIEMVFNWGGLGQYAVDRILALDLPAIQGVILISALLTMLVYLLLDVLVALLDPRVSYGND